MKILHTDLIGDVQVFGVTEFTACRISRRDDSNGYSISLYTESPSRFYRIIRSEREENGVYKWLSLEEANGIVQSLYKNDCLDLTQIGSYHVFEEGYIQTVFIQNDIDEFTAEEIPLTVRFAD